MKELLGALEIFLTTNKGLYVKGMNRLELAYLTANGEIDDYIEEETTSTEESLQVGQLIEVWDNSLNSAKFKHIEKFIGFTSSGRAVTEKEEVVCSWDNYSIPNKKVTYNVWRNTSNNTYQVLAEASRLLGYWEVVASFPGFAADEISE